MRERVLARYRRWQFSRPAAHHLKRIGEMLGLSPAPLESPAEFGDRVRLMLLDGLDMIGSVTVIGAFGRSV